MSDRAYMQLEDETGEPIARWWGGQYIELGHVSDDGEWHAVDVINIWDYAKSEPTIPVTLAAFEDRVKRELAEAGIYDTTP